MATSSSESTGRTLSRKRAGKASDAPEKSLTKKSIKSNTESEPTILATTPEEFDVHTMIATAAYYLAQQRDFTPGHELEDWLMAEKQIAAINT